MCINWIQVATTASPAGREGFSMAYDGALQHIVIFGGQAGVGNFLGDTWQLIP